jgi:hypothetical protein
MKFEPILDPFSLYVYAFGQIVKANGFQGNPIYIKYHIDLPSNWIAKGLHPGLNGTTQSSYGFYHRQSQAFEWIFSHPLEFDLSCHQDGIFF